MKTKLILFASKTQNLAKFISKHYSEGNPIIISPDDNLETVFNGLRSFSKQYHLFGMSVGYNKLIPPNIIDLFAGRLYNIHPGELPLTAGLYGIKVIHKMILSNRVMGKITIHRVNEVYDEGKIVEEFNFYYLNQNTNLTMLNEQQILSGYPLEVLSNDYLSMLKMIEPTIVCKFIDSRS